jgi:hypothetical protein
MELAAIGLAELLVERAASCQSGGAFPAGKRRARGQHTNGRGGNGCAKSWTWTKTLKISQLASTSLGATPSETGFRGHAAKTITRDAGT